MEEIRGTIYQIGEPKAVTEKFTIQEFVIQEELITKQGSFTSWYPIQASGNKLSLLEGVYPGMEVKVTCIVNGRKYNRKSDNAEQFMVTLSLMKLEKITQFTGNGHIRDGGYNPGYGMPPGASSLNSPKPVSNAPGGVIGGLGAALDDEPVAEETDLPF